MNMVAYFVASALLILAAFIVFRVLVRRDYRQKGRLTWCSSLLELVVWSLYMSFPCLYNPPQWVWFWSDRAPVSEPVRIAGVASIAIGFVAAFGTMFWFGLRRAFGLQVKGLVRGGAYRVTRNPQIVGASLLVLGSILLWPSWQAVRWLILYGVVAHLMVITEEEHLLALHGEEYSRYCRRVPRYVGMWWRRESTAA